MNKNNLQNRKSEAAGQSGKTLKQKQKVRGVSEIINRLPIKATRNHRFTDGSLKKTPAHLPDTAPSVSSGQTLHRNPRPLLRAALIVAAYLFAFIILDFITHQFEELPGIVAWYPPAGLTYALLLVFGLRFTPAVTIALFIDSVFIYHMPQPTYLLFLWALIISLIYSAAAAFLRHGIRFDWQLRKFRDVAWFIFTTVLVSSFLAMLSVSSSALTSDMPQSEVLRAIFHWWIGETVGVLTVTPFLLIHVIPWLKRFAEAQPVRLPARRSFLHPTLAVIVQAVSLAFMLYWVFGTHILYEFHPLYLISLPLIWIALDHGFKGVTAGIVVLNFGVILALLLFRSDLTNLGELQLLMIVNCIIGLLMGVVVTERKQADETSQKGEKHFRALVEHSLEEISLVDVDGTLTYESPSSIRPLGYPPNSLVGYNIIDLFHPDDRADAAQLLEQVAIHPGSIKEAQFRLRHQDGSWRWMEGSLTNLLDEPAVQSLVINYRDVTERKKTELKMRRLINDLRNLSEVEKKDRLFAEALAKNIISIKSTLNTDEILDSIIDNINNVVPSDTISIMLIEGEHARIVRSRGYQERGLTDWVKQRQFSLNEIKDLKEITRSKKYIITSNTDKSKHWTAIAETAWIKSHINTPILEDNKVIGFVNVESATPDFYTEEHAQRLMAFTDQVSTALRNAHQFESIQRRMNRMQAMTQIDQAINSSLDLNVSLEIVLIQAIEQLQADAVDILLVDDVTNSLVFSKAKGFKTDEIRKSNFGLGDGLPGKAVLERTTVAIPDLNLAGESYFKNLLVEREGFISYYCVPLITKGQLKGVMEVYFRHTFQADQEWLEFLEMLAQQTAIAINNAELLNSLQSSNIQLLNAYETTLKGWVDALDMRDHETEGHTQRVTELSLKLARLMGIKEKEIVHFQRGALLHDIGKVAVSDAILNKPGPLTEEEWVIMRRHPLHAYSLLSKSEYLKPALDIPFHHHEKWDGSGYPSGLKGEAIPLAARIFAIVDVWDALISDRPYRKAWTHKKALEYIQEQSGKHFDPDVVKVFLNNPSVQKIGDF